NQYFGLSSQTDSCTKSADARGKYRDEKSTPSRNAGRASWLETGMQLARGCLFAGRLARLKLSFFKRFVAEDFFKLFFGCHLFCFTLAIAAAEFNFGAIDG